ncbi:MAG: hypothetical protein WC628_05915 [Candidatus Omnitrophota bacterium]
MFEYLRKHKEEVIAGGIFIFFALGFNIYRVQGDGKEYYAFLERVLHILKPESSMEYLSDSRFYQSGCAFLNAPFYLLSYWLENVLKIHPNYNGITLRQISINLASNFYLLISIIFSIRILKRMNFSHRILPVLSMVFSTSAFSVAVVMPSMNHAADVFIITAFLYLFIENIYSESGNSFWLGAFCVAAVLVRYFNAVLVILAAGYYFSQKRYRNFKQIAIGFLSFAWIIPLILFTYNRGSSTFLMTGSLVTSLAPLPKYALKLLVHPLHGLFVWSPVTLLSVIGLLVLPKKYRILGYVLSGVWVSFVLLYGFFYEWYGGWSFSNRYLVNVFPIYCIGLASFLQRFGKKAVILVILFTVYSVFLFLHWHLCIFNAEFETPWAIFKAWRSGESDTFLDKNVNTSTVLKRLFEYCRYKYILGVFR